MAKATFDAKGSADAAFRRKRHALKMHEAIKGKRTYVGLNAFKAEGADVTLKLDIHDATPSQLRAFIDGTTRHQICLLESKSYDMHAEQKIMIALCRAYGKTPSQDVVSFAGTFRPCRGCYESLKLLQLFLLPNVRYGHHPGHFWQTTTRAHCEIYKILCDNVLISYSDRTTLFDKDGILERTRNRRSYQPILRLDNKGATGEALHYASDSDGDAEEENFAG